MLKKLPIGKSTFRTIIEENYPRRFGKSLFLDTLRTIFDGEKELFAGLHIYDKYEFKKYPVVRISFNDGDFKTVEGFKQTVYEIMKRNQELLGIKCDTDLSTVGCFRELIYRAYEKHNQKVVVLVDEYDKPILDNIENKEVATLMREELKNFYSVIKGSDEYLKFVFITGVSKFSKVSLFSGLNNIEDITLDQKYATICGYTQNDVETVFAKHLEGQDFNKIRHWYNGYKFLGEGVYNPFDILLFISKGFVYDNYWFQTATPTFLLKLIEKNNYFLPSLENIVKDKKMLDSFDVDYIELETLMWQTGYLTIDRVETILDNRSYHLTIPNQEVRLSLLGSVADFMSKIQSPTATTNAILLSLINADSVNLEKSIKSLFACIPYNNFTGAKLYEYEGYFVSVFYAYIKAMGIELIAEDTTNKGRIDLTIKLPSVIYVIEFKTDGSDALSQIKAKGYHEKYMSDGRAVYIVGVEFDTKDRNISKVEIERV